MATSEQDLLLFIRTSLQMYWLDVPLRHRYSHRLAHLRAAAQQLITRYSDESGACDEDAIDFPLATNHDVYIRVDDLVDSDEDDKDDGESIWNTNTGSTTPPESVHSSDMDFIDDGSSDAEFLCCSPQSALASSSDTVVIEADDNDGGASIHGVDSVATGDAQ